MLDGHILPTSRWTTQNATLCEIAPRRFTVSHMLEPEPNAAAILVLVWAHEGLAV